MRKLAGLLFCVSILPFVRATGQVPNGSQSPTIAPNQASKPASDVYAAESVVFEQLSTVYHYAADGTGSKEISVVARIQSDAAARQSGVVNFPFASSTERVEIEYVRVRKPDGSVVETPVTDAQEITQEVTRQAPFYSDLKEKQVPVRNLRISDKLEYKAKIIRTKAETPGDFWGQETFASGVIVLNETIELHVPKNKYVKVWSPEHQPVVSEAGDEKVYRWTGSQLKPTVLSIDDKKKASDEAAKKQINPEGELPAIAWTTFKTWEDVGAWYRGLEGDRITPNADVKAKTAEVIAGKTTDDEKIRAIYAYVATQIRYIGVALGIGRYQPHPAAEVLANQYGDCKDKHTLLAAMLTAAGFHPEAALIGAGIRINPDVPSPSAFNHLITALPLDGKLTWLDSTAEVAPYHMLVITIRDKQALVVPATGAATLQRTPATLPFTPSMVFTSVGKLGTDGTINAHMDYVSRGDDEVLMRTIFRQVAPGQWEQLVQTMSQGLGFSGTTSHADVSRPDNTAEPFKLSYDYVREKLGNWNNLQIIPMFPVAFVPVVDDKNPPTVPIDLGEPAISTQRSVITLPDGWGAVLPDAVHKKNAYITFDKTYKIEGETLTVDRKVEVLKRRIPVADWKIYKKWVDDTLSDGEPWIQLTRSSSAPGGKDGTPGTVTIDTNGSAETLVKAAYLAVQRHDLDSAEQELDLAKGQNPKEHALWSTYGYLAFQRKEWAKAIEAYDKELALYPNTPWIYEAKAHAQYNLGLKQEAKETLRRRLATTDNDLTASNLLAAWLLNDKENVEAASVLKDAATKNPANKGLSVRLGKAQLQAGEKAEGIATLSALLKETDDSEILNDASYELINANVELELAESGCRKSLEIMSGESEAWTLDGDAKTQTAKSSLIAATWDTLGWILFREGKLDAAEEYIHAALLNSWHAEAGLHLGEIQEQRGNKQAAYTIYQMILLNTPKNTAGELQAPASVIEELKSRSNALSKQGVEVPAKEVTDQLAKWKKLPVAKTADHVTGIADYDLLISVDKVAEIQPAPDAVTHVTGGVEKVRAIPFKGWTPPGSKTKIRLRGLLNCRDGACSFNKIGS